MLRRFLLPPVWMIIPALMCGGAPVEAGELEPLRIERLMPALMFKITRLSGIGPDGSRSVLMNVPEGVVVAVDDFSGLSSRLTIESRQTPAAFHTLQAELFPGVFAMDQSGTLVQLAQPYGVQRKIALLGVILKMNNEVKMLDVHPEFARTEAPRSEQRSRECGEREHDD